MGTGVQCLITGLATWSPRKNKKEGLGCRSLFIRVPVSVPQIARLPLAPEKLFFPFITECGLLHICMSQSTAFCQYNKKLST